MKYPSSSLLPRLTVGFISTFAFAFLAWSQSATWDGDTDATWNTGTNWSGDVVPGNVSGSVATFSGNSTDVNGNVIIDLGGNTQTGGIVFDSANAASYTIGVAGVDTLALFVDPNNGDNDADITVNSNVVNDQTIAANLILGDGTGTTGFVDENRINNNSTSANLFITGDIAAGTGGTVPGDIARLWLAGNGNITVSGDINETPVATSASRIDWFISGTGEKTFSGTFTGSTNNYLRPIIRDNGTFTLASGSDFGGGFIDLRSGTLNVNASTLLLSNGLNLGDASQGTGNADVVIASGSTVQLSSNINYEDRDSPSNFANVATITGGTLQLTGADRTIDVDDNVLIAGAELTISSNITNDGTDRALVKNDTGTLLLSGTNTYGDTRINNGLLIVAGGNALSDTHLVTVDTAGGEGDLQLNNDETVGNFDGTGNINLQANTLTFGDASSTAYSGLISGAGGGLVKNGSGTTSLTNTGAHSYTGDTIINAGTLEVAGTLTSNITVNDGGNIGGEGTTSGNLVFAGTTHTLSANASTTASLGTTSVLDVSAPTTITINLAGTGVGNVSVLEYGTLNGDTSNFVLGSNNTSSRGGSIVDTGSAIAVNLGLLTNTWTGSNTTNPTFWDVNTTNNWSNASDNVFLTGDGAVFDDTASNFAPTLQGNITADSVTFNNNTNAYTLASNSTEVLTVLKTFNTNNAANVTVNSDVNVGETINVNGSGSTVFNGLVTFDNGPSFDGTGDSTYFGGIAGTGDLVKNGSGTVRFQTVAPSFTGNQFVNEGTLLYFSNAIDDNVNESNYTTVIAAGATLEFNTNGLNESINTFDFGGGGTFKKSGNGQFNQVSSGSDITFTSTGLVHVAGGEYQFGGGTPGNWSSNLGSMQIDAGATFSGRATSIWIDTLTGDGRFQVGGKGTNGLYGLTLGVSNGTGIFNGLIEDDTGAGETEFTINKVGTGTQTLNGDNTYTGDTTITGGQLNINGTNVSSFFVADGANLGGEGSTTGNITFQGATHTLDINALTSAALGSTATGALDVSAVGAGGFTVNVSGVAGDITVLTYGSGGFTGDINAFALGANTSGSRGFSGFVNDVANSAIKVNLGYADNTWTGATGSNWDINNTANWSNTSDSIFLNLDDATFDDTATNFTPTLQEDITASRVAFENNTNDYTLGSDNGSRTLTSNNSYDFTGSGNVSVNVTLAGTADLNQTGSGTTTLSQSNSYTGTTTIGAGTLVVDAANALGTGGNITFSGGTLQIGAGGTTADYGARIENSGSAITIDTNGQNATLSGAIDNSNTGGLNKLGSGNLSITGATGYTGITTVNEGTLVFVDGALTDNRSYGPIASGATLEFRYDTTNSNGGNNVGNLNLSGNGTFKKTGTASLAQVSAGSTIAFSSGGLFHVAEGAYTFGAGGLGDWTGNLGDMQIDAGATYEGRASALVIDALNGGGTLGIGGVSTGGIGTGIALRLGVDNGDGVFNGTIKNTNGDGALFTLEKVGTGTQDLNGNNTYTGDTTINGGLLNINGTNVSNITVAAGGNIGGEGSTSGNLTFAGTTHTLAIDAGTSEALGTSNVLDVTAVNVGGLTVNATGSGSGNITVLEHGGTFNGSTDRFTLGSGASLRGASGFTDTGSAIVIDLGFVTRTWSGATDSVWDSNTTANWQEGDMLFVTGDNVIFDDTLTANSLVNLGGNIQAGSITFDNDTTSYIIAFDTDELSVMSGVVHSGNAGATINTNVGTIDGGILASGQGNFIIGGNVNTINDGLSVTGGGDLILNSGANITNLNGNVSYTGTGNVTTNSGSTIANVQDITINTPATTTLDGNITNLTGTLSLAGAGDSTLNGTIAGTGSLSKSGGGTAILNGANTFTGNTTISGGALAINASEVLNDSTDVSQTGGNLYMVNGTTETVNSYSQTGGIVGFGFTTAGGQSGSSRLNINGDSAFNNIQIGTAGTLGVASGVTATLTGSISQLGDNQSFNFDVAAGAEANVSAAINTGKGNGQINKTGTGILRLTANNSQYGGGNRFTNGTVEFTSIVNAGTDETSSLGDADFQDVLQIGSDATSATLRMTGTNAKNTSDRSVQIGDAGGTIEVADAAQILTLNGTVSGNGTTGNGALTTGGAGTLVLAGNNTYTGGTTVTSGTLLVNNTAGSGTGTGAVIVNSGATIGGNGTIGGAATISGAHSAGGSLANTSVAQQTVSGDLTYNSGATVSWDLIANSSSNPGTDFDQFVLGGALDFSGPTSIDLNFDGGAVDWTDSFWDADQNWTIYSGATSLANANNLSILAEDWMDMNGVLFSTARGLPNGASFSIGASGNDIVLTFTAVPEPSTYALMGIGLAAFGWVARKRRRKQANEAVDSES